MVRGPILAPTPISSSGQVFSCHNLEMTMTDVVIRRAYRRYKIPHSLSYILHSPSDRTINPLMGYIAVLEYILWCGVKVPFHLFIECLFKYYGLAPFQLTPNSYRHMVGFYILYCELGFWEPNLEEFVYMYSIKANPKDNGFYYSSKWPIQGLKALDGIKSNMGKWKLQYFFLECLLPRFFRMPSRTKLFSHFGQLSHLWLSKTKHTNNYLLLWPQLTNQDQCSKERKYNMSTPLAIFQRLITSLATSSPPRISGNIGQFP